ncbi:PREDICTED: uncharacterized protein LOC108569248 [Nicrophorus vespilloides]|uniref:Uncharacterized protein LOC108569248 n=1 Tax=Nicrophorus vespilloides TaxID=110193 RepID=A0ABM1NHB5_NICVS|nr:PREDICTED: uncharacterized protein LOC108569248 [Nicrophorus vespilloides]
MELPNEIQTLFQKYNAKCDIGGCNNSLEQVDDGDIIDVEQINLGNDESWLMETKSAQTLNLSSWLYNHQDDCNNTFNSEQVESKPYALKKNIDTRTFTRPKKRNLGAALERYNEEDERRVSLSNEIHNYISNHEDTQKHKPLDFDLSQPTYTHFFDNILASAKESDCFLNMSPPSLVNSMCSSTFTNLMESSMIKNDPVLREISNENYGEEALNFQVNETQQCQSFTESCSSINSDSPETFLQQTLPKLNGTFNNITTEEDKGIFEENLEDSFNELIKGDRVSFQKDTHAENIDPNITINKITANKFNATYEKRNDNKFNNTFKKDSFSEVKILNSTFQKVQDNKEREKVLYEMQDNNLNQTFRKKVEETFSRKSSSIGYHSNSTETVDCNSTVNLDTKKNSPKNVSGGESDYNFEKVNSSLESCKESPPLVISNSDNSDVISPILNTTRDIEHTRMAEVEAIVQEQERSLRVMSTPKPSKSLSKLFENARISPIPNLVIKSNYSDSELSSEEYSTVRSTLSEKPTLERNVKSLSNLKQTFEVPKSKMLYTMSDAKGGSLLKRPESKIRGSCSNLRSLNSQLRKSYTNLQPYNSNLPNVGARTKVDLNATQIRSAKQEVFKVPDTPKEQPPSSANDTFVKPQSKMSSLPRPISSIGIHRSMSRIPGPKSAKPTNIRQISRSSSKINVNDGH